MSPELYKKVSIILSVPEDAVRWCRLRYFGHIQRMNKNVWSRKVNDFVMSVSLLRGFPNLHWSDVTTNNHNNSNIRKELIMTIGYYGEG